jgi:hypothetical protein
LAIESASPLTLDPAKNYFQDITSCARGIFTTFFLFVANLEIQRFERLDGRLGFGPRLLRPLLHKTRFLNTTDEFITLDCAGTLVFEWRFFRLITMNFEP